MFSWDCQTFCCQVLHEATRKIRGYYDFYEMTLQAWKLFSGALFFRNIQKQAAVIFWISFSIIKQKSWIYNFHFHSFSFRWKPSWMKCRAVTVARLPTNSHKIFKNAIFSKLDLQQKNVTRQVYWCVHILSIGHWPLDTPCCCWELPSSAWTKSCDILLIQSNKWKYVCHKRWYWRVVKNLWPKGSKC